MFVVVLAQVATAAHTVTDFHTEGILSASTLTELGVTENINDNAGSSQHKSCAQSCHGHSHFYMSDQLSKSSVIQKEHVLNNKKQLSIGLVHGPDSPPPDIS